MKRIHCVSMCAIMALMIASNSHARSPIMRIETSRVMVENFTVDRQSLPQDIIGFYNAYDIDWKSHHLEPARCCGSLNHGREIQ